jgi:hypothetical protein
MSYGHYKKVKVENYFKNPFQGGVRYGVND